MFKAVKINWNFNIWLLLTCMPALMLVNHEVSLRLTFPHFTTLQFPSASFERPSMLSTLIGSSLELALTWVLADAVTTLYVLQSIDVRPLF